MLMEEIKELLLGALVIEDVFFDRVQNDGVISFIAAKIFILKMDLFS